MKSALFSMHELSSSRYKALSFSHNSVGLCHVSFNACTMQTALATVTAVFRACAYFTIFHQNAKRFLQIVTTLTSRVVET